MKKTFFLLFSIAFCISTNLRGTVPDQRAVMRGDQVEGQISPARRQAMEAIQQTTLAISQELTKVFELSAMRWDSGTTSKFISDGMQIINGFDSRYSKFYNHYMQTVLLPFLSKNPVLPRIKQMLINKTHNPQIVDQLEKAVAAPFIQNLARKFDSEKDSQGNNVLDDIISS